MFLETPTFPTKISYGSKGGPRYQTTVVVNNGGWESRNIDWEYPLHEYDAAFGVRRKSDLEELLEFFHAVRGKGHGFRYKDWGDFKSCKTHLTITATDQVIGTGDTAETDFQLVKNYTAGTLTLARLIKKPVDGTVKVALDSVEQETGWSVDTTTGVISFDTPPGQDVVVAAGYEFDVPVRFDTDALSLVLKDYLQMGTQVPIIEVRKV
jgi:uncharacterized protein (TIGR02217 family)